jgi:hypothetical protein
MAAQYLFHSLACADKSLGSHVPGYRAFAACAQYAGEGLTICKNSDICISSFCDIACADVFF